ncbi:PREDICTED: uncharacterized protein LOC109238471 [Nicotiana attenuata]|uniref:Uncharacterized protein n=1 Tax=Nicotiana attenuata TaxID=49451 RepID=A0A314LC07_NICAT|nr:PREDICTED: uncharacterized protein LOC109238471 [Nicotiana attenuata]OIT39146.1 hypothetical protein A4A49_02935 [Nicotiana attenuata]
MELLKLTDEEFGLFRDRVAFAFMICGGGMHFDIPIMPCHAVPLFVWLTMIMFVIALFAIGYVLYANIVTMQPRIIYLDHRKRAIAKEVMLIMQREFASINNEELDLEVSSVSVMERYEALVKFGEKINLKRNYRFWVGSSFGCLLAYGVMLCFIAYYKHTSSSGCQ